MQQNFQNKAHTHTHISARHNYVSAIDDVVLRIVKVLTHVITFTISYTLKTDRDDCEQPFLHTLCYSQTAKVL